MEEKIISMITLLSPVLFVIIAIGSRFQSGRKIPQIIQSIRIASFVSVIIALTASLWVYYFGAFESPLIGIKEIGFSIRLDALSLLMLSMISILGAVIINFSFNYLDGDPRQGIFLGRLAATLASVQLLVISGNIGVLFISWVMTSMALHRLLLFYPERVRAQVAAKKKFVLARLGDVSLFLAFSFIYLEFGTGNLGEIFSSIQNAKSIAGSSVSLELSALFLALAAILKSALFPTHGWLVEVMETPTPVSALLHAGLLNAGPFLIIRMSFLMEASSIAPLVLMIMGGFTALFASIVYLTQPSVKTALGYSSIGHMGFSLMVCGLGVYSAAMLHLMAHSFYKAHSFLSSGSAIEALQGKKMIRIPKKVSLNSMIISFLLSSFTFLGIGLVWGVEFENELGLVVLSGIMVLGLAKLFNSAISMNWNPGLFLKAFLISFTVSMAFFGLERGVHFLLQNQIPVLTNPSAGKLMIGTVLLLLFGISIIIQMLSSNSHFSSYYRAWGVHFKNGLYANIWFDRLLDSLSIIQESSMETFPEQKDEKVKSEKESRLQEQWA